MADFAIATELTQQVLEARRLRGELGPCPLHTSNGHLYRLTGYRAVVEDGDQLVDPFCAALAAGVTAGSIARPRGVRE